MHCVTTVGADYEEDADAKGTGSDDYYSKL